MKRRLYFKLVGSYFIFAIVAMIIMSTFTQNITENFLIETEAKDLNREATLMASELRDSFSGSEIALPDVQDLYDSMGSYMSAEIWIVDTKGNILLDSSNPQAQSLALLSTPFSIQGFDISNFGNSYYCIGNFYGEFNEDTLTVFSPITSNYKVRGYVMIHKSLDKVLEGSAEIVNITFYTAGLILACALALLIVFTFVVYKPIRQITDVAENYAKGDFSKQIEVKSNDEIGYLANTLNYMATELDTFEEEQRKFISNVSHDFRSPLTSIKGYIEAMQDGTIPPEMQDKYLNIILFETERLNKLTQNLLDLNKFGEHGIILDITEFDINQMIRTTTLTFEGVCKEKGLSFDLLLTGESLLVRGDMSKIQQVLYNLIDNATKFSNNDSTITVETSIQNEKVLISIKDNGIGIPKDSIKKIWERFYKTDLSRGKDKKGTGLGLAIVKEIIQAHNENINVISTEGVGSMFVFTLPLVEEE